MKKVSPFILVLVICLSLCACTKNEPQNNSAEQVESEEWFSESHISDIDNLLHGRWERCADTGAGTQHAEILEFSNGSLYYKSFLVGYEEKATIVWGTYEITDDHIITTLNGTKKYFDYTVSGGTLTIGLYIDSGADKGTTRIYEQTNTSVTEAYGNEHSSQSNDRNPSSGEKNALRAAENYLSVMPFSYTGLIEQLEFEGYSHSEAVYAADNCGADWYEQAVKAAKNYLEIMAFSRTRLIEQLEYEGYTHDQAVYGADKAY